MERSEGAGIEPAGARGTVERTGAPDWLGEDVAAYVAHVETGRPIRALAREAGTHASTVLRQIRRFERRRDDPLVDEALEALAPPRGARAAPEIEIDRERVEAEARRVLPELVAPGALLVVADGMERGVVVRETEAGRTERRATIERRIARALALKGWIACTEPGGRVTRYALTTGGRGALRRLVTTETAGLSEMGVAFLHATEAEAVTRSTPDTPLQTLGRRRGRDGRPFLDADLVAAGERLSEDFAAAGLDRLDVPTALEAGRAPGAAPRVRAALVDLGEGLAEIAVRTCCYREGLEQSERRLGWSARSGKIVLRIALQRLARHYADASAAG
ncbi:MAG: DUF6456 domain-containing protein [Hasllibacter sp.]